MIALPGQLFYTTQIPVCLWFLARDKSDGPGSGGACRDRRGETLFIDARQMGALVDRTHRELTDEDIARIAGTYHAWRGEPGASELRRRARLLQERHDRADRRARLRAHARPLRRRRRRRGRRRALRREDEAPDGGAGRAAGAVKKNATIDWNLRESARAKMRVMVKRLLAQARLPARQAGARDGARARAGRGRVRGVGGVTQVPRALAARTQFPPLSVLRGRVYPEKDS